jgi:hypothetical protein
MAKHIEDTKK